MEVWEVWIAKFPYEENRNIIKGRPVIIVNIDPLKILSIKVTTHTPRDDDKYDIPIIEWKEAGLREASTARIGKSMLLSPDKFIYKIGKLQDNDKTAIYIKYIEFTSDIKE